MTRRVAALPLLALLLVAAPGGAGAGAPVPLRLLVGQTVVVRMPGRTPAPAFLARIRRGEVGGVVLYAENIGPAGPVALVRQLQAAARAGGNPPLLIGIDQEGGIVRRLPGAPTLAPPQMTSAAVARAQGLATARTLAAAGVNVDLAPVLDVGHGGFITPRTFGSTPGQVATRAVAFAAGLLQGGVMATGKHFPGLGYAAVTTDSSAVTVAASRGAILADLEPFNTAIGAGLPLVMLSTATYPSLGVPVPAACSAQIVTGLLRGRLAFKGVAITDALDSPAVTRYLSPADAALAAERGGVDMVLAAGDTSTDADRVSTGTYARLLTAAEGGRLPRSTLEAAYGRILQLKQRLLVPPVR